MGDAIAHGLRNLLYIEGRDPPRRFWLYILFTCIWWFGVSWIGTGAWATSSFVDMISNPALHTMEDAQAGQIIFRSLTDSMIPMMWVNAALSLVVAGFTLAAFIRRLHDSNLSGYWALLPYGLLILSLLAMPYQMQLFRDMMATMPDFLAQAQARADTGQPPTLIIPGQAEMTLISSIGWIQIISFIILAVQGSTRGPNRFGEEPPAQP